MLDYLNTPSKGNALMILAHQYIAAILNVARGASTTPEVDRALADAADLIVDSCGRVISPSSQVGSRMVEISSLLDAYNNGLVGPGHCN